MLNDYSGPGKIYVATGYTDLRKGIDGLALLIQEQFHLDPGDQSLFLFCGRRADRIKVLLWEGDGFVLLYKRLENGYFRWPRSAQEVQELDERQFRWLMEGLKIEQKQSIKKQASPRLG